MANVPGYEIIRGLVPQHEKIAAAKREISGENLQKFQQSTASLGFERLGWDGKCDELLHDGINLSENAYLKRLLRCSYESAKINMADVVVWIQNPKPLHRLKAGRGRVFIYKAFEERLGPHNGFFKIMEGSHRMSPEQIANAHAKEIYLEPGQAIIVDGELVIEYPQAGGGVGLLKCLTKERLQRMGEHLWRVSKWQSDHCYNCGLFITILHIVYLQSTDTLFFSGLRPIVLALRVP